MRIGFDARPIGWSGVGTYSRGLLSALSKIDLENEYILFCNEESADLVPSAPNFFKQVVNLPIFSFKGQFKWAKLLKEAHLDICHFPLYVWPIFTPCPSVVTIHDITTMIFPETIPSLYKRIICGYMNRSAIKKSEKIITVSLATSADLTNLLNVPASKIEIIYEAVDERFKPVKDRALLSGVKEKYGIDGKFLLNVGNPKAHKNWARLIEAFAKLESDLKLVLVGTKGNVPRELSEQVKRLNLSEAVIFPRFISDEDMSSLYSAAEALVFPSLYEGFGLPVLEAMACGTSVICSNVSSLPEVVGDAAIKVDPMDVDDISRAMRLITEDFSLRNELVEKGLARVKEFSWEKTASKTLEVYREVYGE
ncbi:glycosyltransferase family 1 protein [Candidatus Oleimmundimicrobium sp.]|uniref:glycosyltransferase family 4 protein n=1 Tax=Candidatus Oleimmundimicrobium sp. TaxID=3060597 RepID=UPI00271C0CAF|nr:glycosyltransferase family 1 protein [Candidatus Oleimmundimicrobium sp.]MDO8886940.1 glycosyltransferase family 1 protein [Candidatus Oleimmundimicrobium sp.]